MTDTDEFDVTTDGYFAIVPEWVIDADISDRAVRLYAVLRRHAGSRLMARPSRAKLALRMRTSAKSVDRALRELETIGAVTIRHRWTNAKATSYAYRRDAEHLIPAPSGYVVHNAPKQGGMDTPGPTPMDTGDQTPMDRADQTGMDTGGQRVGPPVGGGVGPPVTHERESLEPKPVKEQKTSSSAKPPRKPEPKRDDVEALCNLLAQRMIENDCKPPRITDTWRRAARMMLDADGREFDKAMRLLEWCQSNEFWQSVVHSMPTFREKYDTIRQQGIRSMNGRPPSSGPPIARADQKIMDTFSRADDLKRRLAANQLVIPGQKEITR